MAQARRTLDNLKDKDAFDNTTEKKRLPYILQNYEVFFGTCHYSWSFTTQIRGGLANLLSTKWKLPNHIYVLFSNDQIEDSDILGDLLYKVLTDLCTFINRSLAERKSALPKKARRANPTEVTIVKTVARSNEQLSTNNFKNRRRTFNRALQKTALSFGWRSINIDAIIPSDKQNFDDDGNNLSETGLKLLWQFLSDDLRALTNASPAKKYSRANELNSGWNRSQFHNHKDY